MTQRSNTSLPFRPDHATRLAADALHAGNGDACAWYCGVADALTALEHGYEHALELLDSRNRDPYARGYRAVVAERTLFTERGYVAPLAIMWVGWLALAFLAGAAGLL